MAIIMDRAANEAVPSMTAPMLTKAFRSESTGMLTLVLCLALSSPVLSATDTGGDAAEGSGDTVAILQQRVSEDIAGSKDAVEAELKDLAKKR